MHVFSFYQIITMLTNDSTIHGSKFISIVLILFPIKIQLMYLSYLYHESTKIVNK